LADDHPRVLSEIHNLLCTEFEIVATVSGGSELVEAAKRSRPDVVVSDISMPDWDGIAAGQHLIESGVTAAVILVTMYRDAEVMARALTAGVLGLLLKVDVGNELIEAVHCVHAGKQYLSSGVRECIRSALPEYDRSEGPPCPD
jgi:DNA-binding NarL/FixJ family response regulator